MKASAFHSPFTQHRATHHAAVHRAGHVLGQVAALALLLVSTAAWAAAPSRTTEPWMDVPAASTEMSSSPIRGRGGDMTRASLEMEGRSPAGPWSDNANWRLRYVRWSAASERSSLGISMGVDAIQPLLPRGAPSAMLDARNAAVMPEVGVRWRSSWQSNRRVDVGAFGAYDASANTPQDERRAYNARVELQFREGRSKLGFDMPHGALGMQLSGNSQMLLRARHGKPVLYYRAKW